MTQGAAMTSMSATPHPVLSVRSLTHRYGDVVAVDDVDLEVVAGECVALLGPNGAGKTTLVRAVIGLQTPHQGAVAILGRDARSSATRRHLGVMQQSVGFPRTSTVRELLASAALQYRKPTDAVDRILTSTGLADLGRRLAHRLSGGQQRRVQLALALIGEPDLLVLDEPTEGLDLESRRAFWTLIDERREVGTAVLLTTHLIEEAARVADRVVVLAQGRVIASDTPAALRRRLAGRRITCRSAIDVATVRAHPAVSTAEVADAYLHVVTSAPETVLRELLLHDPTLTDLSVDAASLEDAVLGLTVRREEVPA
jgi:ABC-2 type transport system ATP-binding protein